MHMKLLYRLHRQISVVCAAFFLLLVLTGLPLLFNGDLARWNALEERPSFGGTSASALWAGALRGLERVEREHPGRSVQSIAANPERGILVYRMARAKSPRGKDNVEALAYAPQQEALVPWQQSGVKSPALAAFLGWMHQLHIRLAMGRGGMIFLLAKKRQSCTRRNCRLLLPAAKRSNPARYPGFLRQSFSRTSLDKVFHLGYNGYND